MGKILAAQFGCSLNIGNSNRSMARIATFNLCSSCSSRSSSVSFSRKPSFFPMRISSGTPLRYRFPKIFAFSSNDIKVGSNVEVDGAPWRVIEFLHVKPGKGAAFVRTKMRNYVTGNTVEKTFRAGSTITEANMMKETKQYTYKDGNQFVFMDLVIDFELPVSVKLTVVDVDPGLRGDTAQGGSKPATLDTGAVVNVPLFVNIGDEIMVDTRTGQYMSRA
ncbi:elongation factor P isoform X2 [Telopea speciosissima]|uniref:elongation factor P isoform X2 n=1 Tax=Telopea speciosissima TaxID=54955 RepID=UPI001CC6A60E|nr:elongation factor P isoform X2 [Telopea speciosissima]